MGITWGLWISPAAQRRANYFAVVFGILLSVISMGALAGFGGMSEDQIQEAREVEGHIFHQKVESGEVSQR